MFCGPCVCLLAITMSCAKMVEPVEMLLGDLCALKEPCIRWGPGSPQGNGAVLGAFSIQL